MRHRSKPDPPNFQKSQSRAEYMAKVVEHQPSNHKDLSSNPSTRRKTFSSYRDMTTDHSDNNRAVKLVGNNCEHSQVPVSQACIVSYAGHRDQEDFSLKPPHRNSS
jgi:hypothetical protein